MYLDHWKCAVLKDADQLIILCSDPAERFSAYGSFPNKQNQKSLKSLKKAWKNPEVSDASHFLLEKISKAHKMSPAHTIYHVILIYSSQWTVGNGGGERWRAYNIQLYSELYIRVLFFLYTQISHSISSSLLQKKIKRKEVRKKEGEKERKKIHIFVLFYVLQVASSLCQLSVGVQPFLGNMLYLLSSCVCDITELLLWRAMNGAIMRDR